VSLWDFKQIPHRHSYQTFLVGFAAPTSLLIFISSQSCGACLSDADFRAVLDRDVRKPNENPSVGLILCSKKDDEVVGFALARSASPALIAVYQTHLPQKALLENKLRELAEAEGLAGDEGDGDDGE
jgi:hypothetical protein